jgi:hypothetical protein
MNIVLFILITIITLLNVKAMLVLKRTSYYDTKQKYFQIALILLVPVIGAILVWYLAAESAGERVTTDLADRGFNPDGYKMPEQFSVTDAHRDIGGD